MKTQLYFVLFLILTIEEMPFFWKIDNFNIVETIEEMVFFFKLNNCKETQTPKKVYQYKGLSSDHLIHTNNTNLRKH